MAKWYLAQVQESPTTLQAKTHHLIAGVLQPKDQIRPQLRHLRIQKRREAEMKATAASSMGVREGNRAGKRKKVKVMLLSVCVYGLMQVEINPLARIGWWMVDNPL